MDPNTALTLIRQICERVDQMEAEDIDPLLGDLVDQFTALDEWLVKGGFLPKDWRRWVAVE